MRCGVIGAPGWELLMANIASSTAGVTLGGEGFTEAIFTFAIFLFVHVHFLLFFLSRIKRQGSSS